ncbi:MAG: M20/M25/M40 family metallo-hydrolase [Proteobacteria bacterium]|nr:M20/M25/M40 family metallo-hydrolase [Pseudomonadota bacterium]
MNRMSVLTLAILITLPFGAPATPAVPHGGIAHAHALLGQMIAADTTPKFGTTELVNELAHVFVEAGFPPADVQVVGNDPKRMNLVVRFRGRGERRPILLMGHLDVVPVDLANWHTDPFKLTERDGYFYGRGTMDIKGADAGLIATFLKLHAERFVTKGDYILALTAGEEDGVSNGIQWLLANRPDLIRAQYAINVDGGGPELSGNQVTLVAIETAEKVYESYTLTARGPGGHSSIPKGNNPIYRLATGLERLSTLEFPLATNSASRAYFARLATVNTGNTAAAMRGVAHDPSDPAALRQLAARSPYDNAHLRTTCVPTLLTGGDAENALPQVARATINCRIMPDESPSKIQAQIVQALGDSAIEVQPVAPAPTAPPSPIDPALFDEVGRVAQRVWGHAVPVSAYMSAGASDSVFLRAAGVPSYVFNGIAYDVNDDRSHAPNERILVRSFDESLQFDYLLLKAL